MAIGSGAIGGHNETDLYEVNLSERVQVRRSKDIQYGDDVFVVKVFEDLDLPQRPQAKHRMIEWRYSLDRHLASRSDMYRTTHDAICSFTWWV
jgi:hypothetical protein